MISNHFTTDFSVYRVSASIDANNFEIEADVLHLTNKGFFEPLSGTEILASDKIESRTTHRLFCPVLDIVEADKIVIATVDYNVDLIQNFHNNHMELYLKKRK